MIHTTLKEEVLACAEGLKLSLLINLRFRYKWGIHGLGSEWASIVG